MKLVILLLTLSLSACVSIQEKKEANVAPQLDDSLDEGNYKDKDNDNDMVIMMGNCKGLENSDYCDSLKKTEEDNQKQLDESLKKHSKKQ
ncbi:hypothetical protein RGQ13_01155 [Thalassotalea psychrophila]|uniref:Lipoprotein n=1 Tax=Thalassotalea psychrophila TaxID=3065647 RepID=A0ABY9TWC6_9GAMM|nr:hypothetical protein RGQ13_01155 [Colwelliaceae bacterium SQ149]